MDLARAVWRKSSRSGTNGCFEVALATTVGVRDSKDRNGPALRCNVHEWETFMAGVRNGKFDQPKPWQVW